MITHQGKSYARVTSVLRPFSDYGHIDKAVLANKCRIGTEVHQAIADDIDRAFPLVGPDTDGYFTSFSKWKHRLNPQFIYSEQRYFCHEKMITGQIDSIIQFPGSDEIVLIDFKTSTQASPVVWPMQAHLYHYLLHSNGIKVSNRFLFLKLDKYGNYPVVFQYEFDANTHARCMLAIKEYWKDKIK